jgi:serine/threonine-protein kinase
MEMLTDLHRLSDAWQLKKGQMCRLPGIKKKTTTNRELTPPRPRSTPVKIDRRSAREKFGLDPLWRPASFMQNDFEVNPGKTITDRTTRLVWQRSGSRFPITWTQATEYVSELNSLQFDGSSNWRLPTIDELVTLLTEFPSGEDYCIEPIFNPRQKWIWSSDRRSFTAAWYVSIDMGYVASQDFTGYYYVRAVTEC